MERPDSQTSLTILQKVISGIRFDDNKQVMAQLCCPAGFAAFDGHFPGQPVLPAVIQLAVVRSLASDLLGRTLEPVRTGRLKFKGMIGPEDRIKVTVEITKEGDNWMSSFKLENDGSPVSSGAILFRERT